MKIGDMVEFHFRGHKKTGKILEIGEGNRSDRHLVDVGEGNGHNGTPYSKNTYTGGKCWWFDKGDLTLVAPKKVFKHGDVWKDKDGDFVLVIKGGEAMPARELNDLRARVQAELELSNLLWADQDKEADTKELVERICTRDKWQRNRGAKKVEPKVAEAAKYPKYFYCLGNKCVVKFTEPNKQLFVFPNRTVDLYFTEDHFVKYHRLATPVEIEQAEGYLAAQALLPKPVYKINKGDKLVNEEGFVVEATQDGDTESEIRVRGSAQHNDVVVSQTYHVDRMTGKVTSDCGAWSPIVYKLDIVGKVVAL